MSDAWLRKYQLNININQEIVENIIPVYEDDSYHNKKFFPSFDRIVTNIAYEPVGFLSPNAIGNIRSFSTLPPKTLQITDLHFEVEIKDNNNTNSSTSTNEAVFRIYNLSPKSRKFLQKAHSVSLAAGYENGQKLPLVYVGQIKSVEVLPTTSTNSGADLIVEIVCTTTAIVNQIQICKSYPPGITLGAILDDLVTVATTKGISKGFITQDPISRNVVYGLGYYMHGNFLSELNKLCSNHYLKASISLGQLNIAYPNESYGELVTVTKEMVIGGVEADVDKSTAPVTPNGKPSGVKFTVFLNGNITAGKYVRISYGDYRGQYKITTVNHRLSFEAGDWLTEVVAVPMEAK